MSRRTFLLFLIVVSATLVYPVGKAAGQLGPCAAPVGPLRPDLIVDQDLLKAHIVVTEETFSPTSCSVVEGCVSSPGTHLLLRFMSSTPNIGQTDLFIGDPSQCLGDLFRFSECHQHLHFQEYADYRLWTVAGYANWVANRDLTKPTNSGRNANLLSAARASGDLIVGRKQGFCIIDIQKFVPGAGGPVYRSCTQNQGLTAGWADQYAPNLACQFVEMTGVAEGDYVLEDQVNPEQLFPETSYVNNAAAVRFHFKPKQGRSGPVVQALD